MASRDRRHSLLARHALSCLAAPALSQRDLAWFCIARGKLPLFGGPRLLALGISGLPRAHSRSRLDSDRAGIRHVPATRRRPLLGSKRLWAGGSRRAPALFHNLSLN